VTSSWIFIYTELRCTVNHTSEKNIYISDRTLFITNKQKTSHCQSQQNLPNCFNSVFQWNLFTQITLSKPIRQTSKYVSCWIQMVEHVSICHYRPRSVVTVPGGCDVTLVTLSQHCFLCPSIAQICPTTFSNRVWLSLLLTCRKYIQWYIYLRTITTDWVSFLIHEVSRSHTSTHHSR
jgi:hypothetical protein